MKTSQSKAQRPVVVVMGVSGSGKTTVGQRVAARLGVPFADADAFHSHANVAKMARGHALNDADRTPWLVALRQVLLEWRADRTGGVLACSALKAAYRAVLDVGDVEFCLLTASPDVLRERLRTRPAHFFDPALLDSQLATLESTPDVLVFDTDAMEADGVARAIVARLFSADRE